MPPETLYPFLAVFGAVWFVLIAVWYLVHTLLTQRRREQQRRLGGAGDDPPLLLPRPQDRGWASRLDAAWTSASAT
jgi:hypothetical protein